MAPPSGQSGEVSELQARVLDAEASGRVTNERHKELLHAILDAAEETHFLSSHQMARRYQVDAATIIRTIQRLGYTRYADFVAALRQHFVARITPYRALKTATEEGRTAAAHVLRNLDLDLRHLNDLRSRLNVEEVLRAARKIRRARRVVIVGIDFAASLALCLDYGLTVVGVRSEAPIGTTGNLLHKLRGIGSKDMLIAISFGRCLRETVNAAVQAKSQGGVTLGITDSDMSPIARHCDMHLVAAVENPSISVSYAAAMALVSALIIASAHVTPKRSLDMLRRNERDRFEAERWFAHSEKHAVAGR